MVSTQFISIFNIDKTCYTAAGVAHKDKILNQWYKAKYVIFRWKLQHKEWVKGSIYKRMYT